MSIKIEIPSSIEVHRRDIEKFVKLMVHKLDINSHKNNPTRADASKMIELMKDEVLEFEEQYQDDKTDPNASLELADCANFALLAYVSLNNENGNK